MKDPLRMLKQVQQMQTKMAQVQAELEGERVEASAGGGAVKAVATGSQKLVSITIDSEAAADLEMLQDLVVAAVNEAMDRSRELAASRMQQLTAGLGLPPGLL
jgi:DNA-binding YbaB/EbfC family protein